MRPRVPSTSLFAAALLVGHATSALRLPARRAAPPRMCDAASDELPFLQAKLKAAVSLEDYATAAKLKSRIDELSGNVVPTVPSAPPPPPSPPPPLPAISRLGPPVWQQEPRLPDEKFAQGTAVKRLPGFLSDADMEAIHAAAAQVREEKGAAGDRRNCYEREVREGGRTVFVNERLWQLLPDLFARCLEAVRAADAELWGGVLEGREQISLRSAEYHTVLACPVAMPVHNDYGSLVTMDFMLSDTSEFEGGLFQTAETDGTLLTHEFEKGDALLFLSHKFHAVTELTKGRRNIMVCELWEGVPRRCPQRCDQPWMPCYCVYKDSFRLYAPRRTIDASKTYEPIGLSDIERLRERGILEHRKAMELEARDRERSDRDPEQREPRRLREGE